jgi:hypothetical protein
VILDFVSLELKLLPKLLTALAAGIDERVDVMQLEVPLHVAEVCEAVVAVIVLTLDCFFSLWLMASLLVTIQM